MSTGASAMSRLLNVKLLVPLALVALIVCVFLPPRVMPKPTYSFLMTFDISQSMNVRDVVIDDVVSSRREMSKQAARDLLKELSCGSQIGLSIFTGRRVVLLIKPVEVCEHYASLLASLDLIDGRMRWANASGVGKGLHQSIRAADEIDSSTTVVFMTDGHEAPPLGQGSRGMPTSAQYEVDGLIVGVGGESPARIPKLDTDGNVTGYWGADEVVQRMDDPSDQSQEELSRRQDDHLRKLSRLSGLGYLPLVSPGQLAQEALAPRFASDRSIPVDMRWIPASIALLLLCWRFVPLRRVV